MKGEGNKELKGGEEQMEVETQEVYKEICPYCNREMSSLYKEQLEYNFKLHKDSCKKRPSEKQHEKQ